MNFLHWNTHFTCFSNGYSNSSWFIIFRLSIYVDKTILYYNPTALTNKNLKINIQFFFVRKKDVRFELTWNQFDNVYSNAFAGNAILSLFVPKMINWIYFCSQYISKVIETSNNDHDWIFKITTLTFYTIVM